VEEFEVAARGRLFNRLVKAADFNAAQDLLRHVGNRDESAASLAVAKREWLTRQPKLAESQVREGNLEEARRILEKAREQAPTDENLLAHLLLVLRRLGRGADAVEILRLLEQRATSPRSVIRLGELALMIGNLDRARHCFEHVADSIPDNTCVPRAHQKLRASAINHLGEIAMLAGDLKRAREFFTQRIRFGKRYAETIDERNDPSRRRRSRELVLLKHAYTKRGFAELLQEEPQAAQNSFALALKLDDDYHHAHLGLALVSDEWRRAVDKALQALGKVTADATESTLLGRQNLLQDLDALHLRTLVGMVEPEARTVEALVTRAEDRGKLLFLLARLTCSSRRFPKNVGIAVIRDVLPQTLSPK
jgi:tetratricopeptide (TPR) repeat protein